MKFLTSGLLAIGASAKFDFNLTKSGGVLDRFDFDGLKFGDRFDGLKLDFDGIFGDKVAKNSTKIAKPPKKVKEPKPVVADQISLAFYNTFVAWYADSDPRVLDPSISTCVPGSPDVWSYSPPIIGAGDPLGNTDKVNLYFYTFPLLPTDVTPMDPPLLKELGTFFVKLQISSSAQRGPYLTAYTQSDDACLSPFFYSNIQFRRFTDTFPATDRPVVYYVGEKPDKAFFPSIADVPDADFYDLGIKDDMNTILYEARFDEETAATSPPLCGNPARSGRQELDFNVTTGSIEWDNLRSTDADFSVFGAQETRTADNWVGQGDRPVFLFGLATDSNWPDTDGVIVDFDVFSGGWIYDTNGDGTLNEDDVNREVVVECPEEEINVNFF
uniref:EF-hand domain-containing protein n=1 Tax=Chromera velia CCMP2878 TaxID=1169474 RepID=A0A0G4GNB9_9ALVE|eukprot:Cvel_4957.t1-p1 / transcript=Cvel_4957.t1 / gene=Cvel_4957 / organism=Chromera_velia_CCMP2878 / gene_product=hypothetical protein / transcript_product=hypothetical protein / location=Cvel_scaffold224:27510-30236(+) / protein_length=384 / sequence_SO=supercontig / SO=protein_coding / is_pseudo=false